jgi:hypothetical protein
MGCTKSKIQNVYEPSKYEPSPKSTSSSLDNNTQELLRTYENLQRRRLSYPIEKIFLPPVSRRRSRCQSE